MIQREWFLSGRSMIEMLDVLAIIGMLSLVGISAYKRAIIRHQTNNLIEDVRLAGFIVADEMFSSLPAEQEEVSMAGKFAPKSPYTFTAFKESDITFAVVADSVSYPVCEEVRQRKVDWLEEIRPNGKENICQKDDDNTVSFFFNSAFNTQQSDFFSACKEDADCGECGTCNGRMCVYENGPVLSGSTCRACPSVFLQNSTVNSCHQCKGTFFANKDSHKQCVSCSSNVYHFYTTKEECLRCNKDGFSKYFVPKNDDPSIGSCYDCEGTVSEDGTYCDWNCGKGKIGINGAWECKMCTRGSSYAGTTYKECQNCGDGWYYTDNYCLDCNRADVSSEMTEEECNGCRVAGYNKYWYHIGHMRENVPVGKCLTCEGTVSEDGTYCDWNCGKGKIGQQGRYSCLACGGTYTYDTTREQCLNCDDTFFEDNIARCTKCSINNTAGSVRKADCLRCNEVGYNKYWVGEYIDESSLGMCKTCAGTVSEDGTGCMTE
ncbi:MAG: Tfp pilus assembly protein FimT/FimU [Alphaproteobacteria bacterium]